MNLFASLERVFSRILYFIIGRTPPVPPPVPNQKYASFTMDALTDITPLPKDDYLNIVQRNQQIGAVLDRLGGKPVELSTIGWLFKLPQEATSGTLINDIEVVQLILGIEKHIVPKIKLHIYQANIDTVLAGGTIVNSGGGFIPSSNPSSTLNTDKSKHSINPDYTSPNVKYVNRLIEDDILIEKIDQFEFFDPETKAVFFSTTQLLLMKEWRKMFNSLDNVNNRKKMQIVFSGCQVDIGRLAATANMLELELLNTPPSQHDYAKWFTLKAELVPESELNGGNVNDLLRLISDIRNPSIPTDDSDDALCKEVQENGKMPIMFIGRSCPPRWQLGNAILEDIVQSIDTSEFTIDMDLCELLEALDDLINQPSTGDRGGLEEENKKEK